MALSHVWLALPGGRFQSDRGVLSLPVVGSIGLCRRRLGVGVCRRLMPRLYGPQLCLA